MSITSPRDTPVWSLVWHRRRKTYEIDDFRKIDNSQKQRILTTYRSGMLYVVGQREGLGVVGEVLRWCCDGRDDATMVLRWCWDVFEGCEGLMASAQYCRYIGKVYTSVE